ncbi:MAG: hypothetical protein AB7P03_29595 [Kofleriaceae bacterium]
MVAVVACKSESSQPQPQPQSAIKPRSGKIDVSSGHAPSLPAGEGQASGDQRRELGEQVRERRLRADTDGDGQISEQERKAARAERNQRIYERLDADHDGKVTLDEARDSRWLKRVDDPKKLDPNGDGIISTDELNTSLAAAADERRDRVLDVVRPWGRGRSANPPQTPPPAK